jgi:azurin
MTSEVFFALYTQKRPARSFWLAALVLVGGAAPAFAQTRILIDQPLIAVEYQLARLSNDDLARLERKPDDPRYRPVYLAILTRKGLTKAWRDEAIDAIVKLDKSSAPDVLMQALARVPADDELTSGWLIARLLAEPAGSLRSRREVFTQAIAGPAPAHALAGAYGALLVVDPAATDAWNMATDRNQVAALVRSLPLLPAGGATARVHAALFDPVAALARASTDAALHSAAVRALTQLPASAMPAAKADPLAQAIVARVRETPAERRTDPAMLDLVELGARLTDALPASTGGPLRRELDALGVRVIRIATVAEEMRYDRQWFVVEAGRPVEIVLSNPDAMPHNLVVGTPGSVQQIGAQGSSMPLPADMNAPNLKAFVPNLPSVLYATPLVTSGNQARVSFTAPKEPGEYIFVCTFPAHWMRMYGVMLVVPDLESWRANPAPPTDPMTQKRY